MYRPRPPMNSPDPMKDEKAAAGVVYLVCSMAAPPPLMKIAGALTRPKISSIGISSKLMYRPNLAKCRAYRLRNLV